MDDYLECDGYTVFIVRGVFILNQHFHFGHSILPVVNEFGDEQHSEFYLASELIGSCRFFSNLIIQSFLQ